ncbi:MAG: serine/threonine protein kinase [Hyellaceae cyanobacterium CSU_1_1]|nr:serine/threonine protein kinase [Hyellaceae cyanobacterium CSU_1_1]
MHLPGTIIDNRYQIIQKLGRSEREQTYLAKDLQTMVDAKCIVEQLDFDSENEVNWQIIQEYLFKEVTLIKRLGDHPQIPQIQHYFGEGQQFYLVREYIDGDNLKQEIERKKFDEAETVYLIQDGLRILDFIHKTNVLHRDVQPVHLLRRKQNQAHILINFGALRKIEAKEINLQGELMLSRGIGNPAYAAPEQKAGKFYFSSDIYALAKTAVYALTGRSPWS